jgi:hypothetical protein
MKRNEKRFLYIGKTNRSVFERGLEHQNDIPGCKTSSHMLRHLLSEHEHEEQNWDIIGFGMRIIKSTRTAFERQILESVTIQRKRGHRIMNNKAEYNICALPRLTAKLGEKELYKGRIEDREEMEKEATIEKKIDEQEKDNTEGGQEGKKETLGKKMTSTQKKRKEGLDK